MNPGTRRSFLKVVFVVVIKNCFSLSDLLGQFLLLEVGVDEILLTELGKVGLVKHGWKVVVLIPLVLVSFLRSLDLVGVGNDSFGGTRGDLLAYKKIFYIYQLSYYKYWVGK